MLVMLFHPSDIVLDPEGKIRFVLTNPNAPFAPEIQGNHALAVQAKAKKHAGNSSNLPLQPERKTMPEPEVIGIRVSSKHLTMASRYFRTMLGSDLKEGRTFKLTGYTEINASGWDLDCLLIVLRIAHAQLQDVPFELDVEQMAKVAAIADYYEFDNVKAFASVWAEHAGFGPSAYLENLDWRTLALKLWVAYYFGWYFNFRDHARQVMMRSDGRIKLKGLPLPKAVLDNLNKIRITVIRQALATCKAFEHFYDLNAIRHCKQCQHQYCSLRLDVVKKALHPRTAKPKDPYTGASFNSIKDELANLRSRNPYARHAACCEGKAFSVTQLRSEILDLDWEFFEMNLGDYTTVAGVFL